MIIDKRSEIPWYIKFILEFRPVEYAHDGDVTLCIKKLFGKTYIMSEIFTDELDVGPVK